MKISFTTTLDFGCLGEQEVEVTGSYSPGSPAVMYLRNGDPGYPAEPPEFELQTFKLLFDGPPESKKMEVLELPSSLLASLDQDVADSLWEKGVTEGDEQLHEQPDNERDDCEEER